MNARATSRRLKQRIFQTLMFVLLVLYVAGSFELEVLHSFVHDHDYAITHSKEQERDPCHRLVYHRDVQRGCDHQSHLIVSHKCHMCDLACHGDQTRADVITEESVKFENDFTSPYNDNLDSNWVINTSSRAPPALI